MTISISTPRSASRSTPKIHHGIYIIQCLWQPFWILQEKVGICFYFWIIRLVNSQLVMYSHVRCNPLNTPETPPKTTHMTITNFNYEGSYEVGISFYFWIIRLVNSQLALYSHVIYNHPWHPQNTPTWQLQISTMRTHICQV